MYRVIRSYSRLLRAPSSLILSISRDRASTTSLINLCQCLTILNLGNFFLISSPNLHSLHLKSFPFVCHLHKIQKPKFRYTVNFP